MSALEARFTVEVGRRAQRFTVEADLALDDGVLVLFGPSGCGKTLSIAALAGHLRPKEGRIVIGGRVVFDRSTWVPPKARRVGYVPQHDALFPFLDVVGNVAFGLPRARRTLEDAEVAGLIEELGLSALVDRRPDQLSGGERQRVALGRALAPRPDLLLLDEPFAAIDTAGRRVLRGVLKDSLARHGIPAVFVTHDPEEAAALGSRVAPYERGHSLPLKDARDAFPALVLEATVQAVGPDGATLRDARLLGPDSALPPEGEVVRVGLQGSG